VRLVERMRGTAARVDRVTAIVVAITAVALLLRVYDLGSRAMHHDESLHATYAYYFAQGLGYTHDPLMHGPLQFHLIAWLFRLFGDGEAMARLPSALAGTALVASPLLLRRWLGGTGTVAAAALLTFSPSLLYFSRFARNDLLIALWTFLIVVAIWRYREEGDWRWLPLLAISLALSFATKETTYITAGILLLYLNLTLGLALLARRPSVGWRRAVEAALLIPFAWVVAALWRPLATRFAPGERPREVDLLVVLGTLTLPFLAAFARIPYEALVGVPGDDYRLALTSVLSLFAVSAAVGLSWDRERWAVLLAVALLIVVPLYTTGFTNLDGAGGAFWGSLDYWIDQQEVKRGGQPWFYYFMMVPLYEFAVLLPALAGTIWLLLRGDRLMALLAWWAFATFVALTAAGEKMPWLTVHIALPLALITAHAVGAAGRSLLAAQRRRLPAVQFAVPAAAALIAVALLGLSLRTAVGVAFQHSDTPTEPLIYTQTTPEVPQVLREIEAVVTASDEPVPILVDTMQSLTWPWAWYLRDYADLRYGDPGEVDATDRQGIVIATTSTLLANPELESQFARSLPYRHRWWFTEGRYRGTTWGGLLSGIRDGSLLADWRELYWSRVDRETIGSLDAVVLFPHPSEAR